MLVVIKYVRSSGVETSFYFFNLHLDFARCDKRYGNICVSVVEIFGSFYFFLIKFQLINSTAAKIIRMPIHCENKTCSFKNTKAKVTETGNSNADTILPNPTPTKGNPLFKRIGGRMVPKIESKIPQVYKIVVSKCFTAINSVEIKLKLK